MRNRKKPTDQYHHGDLRSALLAAAGKVVEKNGVEALSLRAVADALGVSHAAPAYHFRTKEALVEALRAEAWKAFAGTLEGTEDLHEAGLAYVRFATIWPQQLMLMFRRAKPSPEVEEHAQRAWAALVERVAKAIGPKRAADQRELNAMTLVAWSQVHGLSALITEGPLPEGFPLEALVERVHDAFRGALRP
jgi:AcrR family transcriptional regulator